MSNVSGANMNNGKAVVSKGEGWSRPSNFPKYPEYKKSDVEWLGEVPEHWQLTPLKHLALLNPKKSSYSGNTKQLCSFVPMEKLKTGTLGLDEERPVEDVFGGYTYFEEGDVLQAKVTPCFENKNIAVAKGLKNGTGFGSSEINVLRPFLGVDAMYLYYRLQEDNYMSFCTGSMIGAGGLRRVPGEVINNFKLAAPTLPEQTQIARFLDHETTKIDTLVQEQQRLIELLKEKRQAVISHAVTKGLDPDVSMKDSGVEWLGEVPKDWVVRKLKNIVSVRGGSTPSKEDENYWHGEIPWVTPKDMKNERIFDSIDHVSESALNDTGLSMIRKGAVLIVVRGMILAHSVPVAINELDVTINQDMKAMAPIGDLSSEYLSLLFQGVRDSVFQYIDASAHGTKKLEWERFELLNLPIPPRAEQDKIISFVSKQKRTIDNLSEQALAAIQLMKERRSALISAAVTGKIDVRNWQPPTGESAFDPSFEGASTEATA